MNLFGSDARPWVTAIAGAAVVALEALFLLGGYAGEMRRRTGRKVPEADLAARYAAPTVRQYLLDAGDGGWHVYRLQLWWDIVYAALVGFAGTVLLDGLFGRAFGADRWWVVALGFSAALAAVADIAEDWVLLQAVGPEPVPAEQVLARPQLIGIARPLTWAKFGLSLLWPSLVVVGAAALIGSGGPG